MRNGRKFPHTVTPGGRTGGKAIKRILPEAEATEGAVDLPDKTPTDNEVNALMTTFLYWLIIVAVVLGSF